MDKRLLTIRCHFCQEYIPWQIVVIRTVIGISPDWICPDHSDEIDERIANGYGQGYFGYRKED